MKANKVLLCLLVVLIAATVLVDGWWSSRSGSSKSSSGSSKSSSGSSSSKSSSSGGFKGFINKAKDAVANTYNKVETGVKNTYNKAKDTAKYAKDFAGGTSDMWRNYNDMKEANTKKSDKYFHAKANYEAANRGPGGKKAAELISNAREKFDQVFKGDTPEQIKADQEANEWGRNGGDPNKYRPNGLDEKYRK